MGGVLWATECVGVTRESWRLRYASALSITYGGNLLKEKQNCVVYHKIEMNQLSVTMNSHLYL